MHRKFVTCHRSSSSRERILTLYRGESVTEEYIRLMRSNIGNIISFNGFYSTSLSKQVAENFMKRRYQEGLRKLLFVIQVDMEKDHNTIFADISETTRYNEDEHLFSIGSMFRIESVTVDENDALLYEIKLSLNDTNQSKVNDYVQEKYAEAGSSINQAILFGKLIFDMNDKHFALDYFKDIFPHLPHDDGNIMAIYYNNLGFCYNAVGDRQRALKFYEAATKWYEQCQNPTGLHCCYYNVR